MTHPAIGTFQNNRYAAKFWFTAFVVVVLLLAAQAVFMTGLLTQPQKVVILDPGKTFHVSALRNPTDDREVKNYILWLAAKSLYDRAPSGFDSPEILQQIYLANAYEKAKEDFNRNKDSYARQGVHQKAEITEYAILQEDAEKFTAVVTVNLLKTMAYGGKEIARTDIIQVSYVCYRNPDMTLNGRLPYAVVDYEERIAQP
jgi:hypothetical protein